MRGNNSYPNVPNPSMFLLRRFQSAAGKPAGIHKACTHVSFQSMSSERVEISMRVVRAETHVKSPSSVTSMKSASSSFVSSSNGMPLVSMAQRSSPSCERYALSEGTSNPPTVSEDGLGVQYFPNICFRHEMNFHARVVRGAHQHNVQDLVAKTAHASKKTGNKGTHSFRHGPIIIQKLDTESPEISSSLPGLGLWCFEKGGLETREVFDNPVSPVDG